MVAATDAQSLMLDPHDGQRTSFWQLVHNFDLVPTVWTMDVHIPLREPSAVACDRSRLIMPGFGGSFQKI
jgi:hypothetical protein